MERVSDSNTLPQSPRKPDTRYPSVPPINRSKSVVPLRIDEQCKKHIRRDGRK